MVKAVVYEAQAGEDRFPAETRAQQEVFNCFEELNK